MVQYSTGLGRLGYKQTRNRGRSQSNMVPEDIQENEMRMTIPSQPPVPLKQ